MITSSSVIPNATIVVPTIAEIIESTHANSLIADIERHLGEKNHNRIGAAFVPILCARPAGWCSC